jgi:hypothetical protein
MRQHRLSMALAVAGAVIPSSIGAHDEVQRVVSPAAKAPSKAPNGGARWLAGDHHIHSRFSTGYDGKTTPPTPVVGADASYPIPMNAVMARRFGLSWMVSTDHGGPNHSKVNHDHAYPELLESRLAVPDLVQFFGMELNSPGADHSSIIVPAGADEPGRLRAIETMFDSNEAFPRDPARNVEPRMIDALKALNAQTPKPVVVAHHPSRSASALGTYGLTTPSELRNWNDAAPEVAIGMEGSPGHQASAQMRVRFAPSVYDQYLGKTRPRGAYGQYPTMGGYDQMTARLGGFWDSMLGEGRRWWITANSDSHVHWTDGGIDFWPGEYSKTYVKAAKDHASILSGLRAGQVFVTTGDLISELDVTATVAGTRGAAMTGGNLAVAKGRDVKVTIRFLDPVGRNANGDDPKVARVDLIMGSVTGRAADRSADTNPTTRVEARFPESAWRRDGAYAIIEHVVKRVASDTYVRVRGTNTAELEPTPDTEGESPWRDLWFYSNPVFLTVR